MHFGGAEPGALTVDAVVNSAGHGAQALAKATDGYPPERVPPHFLAKGNYFAYTGRPVFSQLIYPAPVPGGLGTHVTLDLAGRMQFGPDVEWIDHFDYAVDPRRAAAFYKAIRTYWPGAARQFAGADYSGIRPKLTGPGEPAADFVIDTPAEHGLAGLVHLFGIESPGLTASLSIAEQVVASLEGSRSVAYTPLRGLCAHPPTVIARIDRESSNPAPMFLRLRPTESGGYRIARSSRRRQCCVRVNRSETHANVAPTKPGGDRHAEAQVSQSRYDREAHRLHPCRRRRCRAASSSFPASSASTPRTRSSARPAISVRRPSRPSST